MPDSYPEPSSTCIGLSVKEMKDDVVRIASKSGAILEVTYLQSAGWMLEMRYDQSFKDTVRQMFTGVQEDCVREELKVTEDDSSIMLSASEELLKIDKAFGLMTISLGENVLFQTVEGTFFAHEAPVDIFHSVMSYQHTDLGRHRWFPSEKFSSRMLRFQYPRPEGPVLGLPGYAGDPDRNGYRYELHNTEQPAQIPGGKPTYQSWPMLMHKAMDKTHWVGVFHDNPSHTFVDVGDFYKDRVTFESVTGNSRVFIATGKTLADVTGKWMNVLGTMPMPPLWAFGYQQSRWGYQSTGEIRTVAKRLRDEDFPCDVMYFDIDYMNEYRVFTHHPESFGDLQQCLLELKNDGYQAVCIVDPGIKIDEEYSMYKDLKKMGTYLKLDNGDDLIASVWPGKVLLPDFGSLKVQEWWAGQQKKFLEQFPFAGVWNDMNEPINWDGQLKTTSKAVTERGKAEAEWNLYGYHMAKTSRKGWNAYASDKRTVIITRSGYPGVQQHAIVWHGDNHAWWEHIRLALDTAVAYSLCGMLYTGPDVPGFFENAPDDMAVRFFQLGSFLPFFRGHSMIFADNKEPYMFREPAKSQIRNAIKQRYSLLSEWYSGFDRCVREKKPTLEPVFEDDGDLVRDQFLLFQKFLVCPVVHRGENMRKVWLPKGQWYRLGEKELMEGNRYILEKVKDMTLPVFVRAGSIVTFHEPKRTTAETLATEETHDVYPDSEGKAEGYVFRDDGISVNDPNAERYFLRLTEKGGHIKKETA